MIGTACSCVWRWLLTLFAIDSYITRNTLTCVFINPVFTCSSILARDRWTLVDTWWDCITKHSLKWVNICLANTVFVNVDAPPDTEYLPSTHFLIQNTSLKHSFPNLSLSILQYSDIWIDLKTSPSILKRPGSGKHKLSSLETILNITQQ